MGITGIRRTVGWMVVCVMQMGAAQVIAQTNDRGPVVEDPAKKLLDETRRREQDQQLTEEKPDIRLEEQKTQADDGRVPENLPDVAPLFTIHTIQVRGNTTLSARDLERIVAPFRDKSLGVNRINLLIRRLTVAYVERGYITTRAYLKEQNLASGTLFIDVIEGRVEALRYNGQAAPLGIRDAFAVTPGGILRLQDVEQGVDQMNRLRRNKPEVTIEPGETPGSSIVDIKNPEQDSRYYDIGTDNAGQTLTGEERLRGGMETEGILGLQEYMSFGYTGTLNSNALVYSANAPLGYNTFSYTYSYSDYQSPIGDFALLYGDSRWHNFDYSRIVERDGAGKTGIDIAFSHRSSRRFIDDVELSPQRLSTLRLAINRFERRSWGNWLAEIAVTRGLPWLDANHDLSGLPRGSAHAQFTKITATLSAAIPLGANWLYRSNLSAQVSNLGLYGTEQLFAGGQSAVRGFAESTAAADRGVVWRNDLAYGTWQPLAKWGLRIEPYLFTDGGGVQLISDRVWQHLLGMGAGARMTGHGLQAELSAGWPLLKPENYTDHAMRIFATLSYVY